MVPYSPVYCVLIELLLFSIIYNLRTRLERHDCALLCSRDWCVRLKISNFLSIFAQKHIKTANAG